MSSLRCVACLQLLPISNFYRLLLRGEHRYRGKCKVCFNQTNNNWIKNNPGWSSYKNARKRCTYKFDKAYPDYGARGIRFLFKTFKEFIDHIGPRPPGLTLDRINNDGNYEIGNVRWATRKQQTQNRRINYVDKK